MTVDSFAEPWILWTLLVLHVVAIPLSALGARRDHRLGLGIAAIPPLLTTIWTVILLAGSAEPFTTELLWVEGLDVGFSFRTDSIALLMTLLVSGIGTLVLTYATGYFSSSSAQMPRMTASLLAFSTSMLGLVLADSIWTVFIFWEFTSITSFVLVGHKDVDASVRDAARRALMITGAGGLSLLGGLVILGSEAGTTSLSELEPITGGRGWIAALLILGGVATKSAQVPFHVWLPGAMKAPTPVSAYLHSATMVKAGVLLLAITGPAFVDVATWKWVGLALGITSMLWGGITSLRHRDAKLILAWGTISQLGLLVTLLSVGTAKATFAAISILFAHAIFKAALFAVVGEIDIRTGTRDIRELGGLHRTMPIATAVAVVSGLSMAGVPPLLGFAAKEAAVEAALKLSGIDALIVSTSIIGGSVITVAYTTRFLLGTFGAGPDTSVAPRRPGMTIATTILGLGSIVGYIAMGAVNNIVRPAAIEIDKKAEVYLLYRWPGLTTGFMVSLGIVAAGVVVGAFILNRVDQPAPEARGADMVDSGLDRFLAWAPQPIAAIQHGSLPVYLATMVLVALTATIPFASDIDVDTLVLWDSPFQGALALAIVVAALAGAFVSSRLGAALTLGAVGLGVSGIFVVHGAPDLALTQLVVETVIVVGFVLGLGHLARSFPAAHATWKSVRMAVSTILGVGVALALAASGSNPSGTPPIEELAEAAVDEGGGANIVNVILTDLRALDTLGEVVVLAVVAIGILALANTRETEANA